MLRLFGTKSASKLTSKLRKSAHEICNKLGVDSIAGPVKIVNNPKPNEKNVVSAKKFNSVFNRRVTDEEMTASYKILEEAEKNGPSW